MGRSEGHFAGLVPGYPARVLDDRVITRVLAEALGRGGDLAEIFVEDRTSQGLKLEDRRVEDVVSGRDVGAGVRIIAGDRSTYAFTNLLTREALLDAARAARAILRHAPPEFADELAGELLARRR
jgi:TldD protein